MKINSRHYTLILFALCSIVAAAFGYLLIYRQTIVQAESSATASIEVVNESTKKHDEQKLISVHKDTAPERAQLKSFFVLEDSAVDFIERIEKIGADSQTELELSSILNDEKSIKAKVDIQGTWGGVMSALTLLENMPLASVMTDIRLNTSGDLSANTKAPKANIWRLTLSIEALTRKDIEE